MNEIKVQNKRQIFYLKYKKSSIFDNNLSSYNTGNNSKSKITDKITSKRYDNIFIPKIDTLTSRQRYIKNLYNIDKVELAYTPKKFHSKIKRKSLGSNFPLPLSARNYKKRKMSFFRESSNNNYKTLKILRTTNNHKIRDYYSKFSDIFNLNNNILSYSDKNKNQSSNISNKDSDSGQGINSNLLKLRIKPIQINLKGINNKKNVFQRELILKNNIIKSEREKEELLRRKVKEKIYNKKNQTKKENILTIIL